MATKVIDFSSLNSIDSDIINTTYTWLDWNTVNVGPGIYRANCLRVIERVTTSSSVTVTYDSDNDNKFFSHNTTRYINSDSEWVEQQYSVYNIEFSAVDDEDSEKANYWFKIS